MKKYSRALKAECIELYVNGNTSNQVSKMTGVDPRVILGWVNRHWFGKAKIGYGCTRVLTMEVRSWES